MVANDVANDVCDSVETWRDINVQATHTLKIKIKNINKRKYPLKGVRFFF